VRSAPPLGIRPGEPYRWLGRAWQSPLGLTIRTYGLAIDGIPVYGHHQVEIGNPRGELVYQAGSGDATLAALRAQGTAAWARWQHPLAARELVRRQQPLAHLKQRAVWHVAHGQPVAALATDRLDLRGAVPIGDVAVTDAATGAVLTSHRTLFELEPTYLVYARDDGRPLTSPLGNTLPHPTGAPDHQVPAPVAQQVIIHSTASYALPDPWLPCGATQTEGNNVVAFFNSQLDRDDVMVDFADEAGNNTVEYGPQPDSIGNDFFAHARADRFEVPYDPNNTRAEYFQDAEVGEKMAPPDSDDPALNAKIIATFYSTNWLHDFFYRAGFDEVAGNAQQSNLGRGGVEGDPLIVHAGFHTTFTFASAEGESPVLELGLDRRSASRRDDGMDFSTLAHEWGHYLVGRVAGGTDLDDAMGNPQGLALHEALADFVSVLVNFNAGDDPHRAFAVGSYGDLDYIENRPTLPPGEAPADPMYYGIRRYPYSLDLAKNPLTFRHLAEAPPLEVPFFNWKGRGPLLGESHTAGEVFSQALFQCFGNIVLAHPGTDFETVRSQMAAYLVAGLAAFPDRPTFLDARDAFFAVIHAVSPATDEPACRAGFATRGMGAGARGPDREFGADDPFGAPTYDPADVQESFVDAP